MDLFSDSNKRPYSGQQPAVSVPNVMYQCLGLGLFTYIQANVMGEAGGSIGR